MIQSERPALHESTETRCTAIQSALAGNLKRQRKMANLTQEKLAARCGLQRTYIGSIEQGCVNVSIRNVGKIADALGVSPACLLLGEGEELRSVGPEADESVLVSGECIVCTCDESGRVVVRAIDPRL